MQTYAPSNRKAVRIWYYGLARLKTLRCSATPKPAVAAFHAYHRRRLHADPNAQDQLGETPLHYAALAGQSAAASLLLEAKARFYELNRTLQY